LAWPVLWFPMSLVSETKGMPILASNTTLDMANLSPLSILPLSVLEVEIHAANPIPQGAKVRFYTWSSIF